MDTRTSVYEPSIVIGSLETLTLGVDFSKNILPPKTIQSAAVILTNLSTGAAYPAGLVGTPQIQGFVVLQVVTDLQPGMTYALNFVATVSANEVWQQTVIVYGR